MPSIDPGSRIVPNPRAVYRKLAEGSGGVVLHLDTAAYHGVNETGAFIWSKLEGGTRFGDLVATLGAEMQGAPPTLADEVSGFLADLAERNLISIEMDRSGGSDG